MSEGSSPWPWIPLKDLVAEMCLGKMLDKAKNQGTPKPYLGNINVRWFTFDLTELKEMRFEDDEVERFSLRVGDLVVCEGGEPGRASVWSGQTDCMMIQKALHRIRFYPEVYDPRFGMYFLFFGTTTNRFADFYTGTTIKHLTGTALSDVLFPLPPLPEQHRIVEKIEELFSDLDAGVASLERAKANLKRYRASVLKSAVEGRLTEEWRKEHPQTEDGQMLLDRILRERRERWERDQLLKFKEKGKEPPKNWQSKYEEPSAPDTSELPELPEGWLACSLDSVVTIHDDLREPINAKERSTREGEYPYYGATGQVGWIDGYLMDGEYILLGEDGSPFFDLFKHKAYRVDGKAWVNNHAHVLRGVEGILTNQFLLHVLNATNYHPFANGTTRLKLTQGAMRRIPIPLPPLAEQEQIVALVEERLSQIDSAEKTIDSELIRSKRLRQSILKQAFEGKLVPQDPKDEPASVLLERIKASREAEQPKKKAKKAKKVKAK